MLPRKRSRQRPNARARAPQCAVAPASHAPDQRAVTCAAGFSLIELTVTLAVLFILAGMLAPPVWVTVKREGRVASTDHLHRLATAVEAFYIDTGRLPTTLAQLIADPGDDGWSGPYLSAESGPDGVHDHDAFGNTLVYDATTHSATIRSIGFDRTAGGTDDIVRNVDVSPFLAQITRDRIGLMNAAVIALFKRMGPSSATIPLGASAAFDLLVAQGVLPNNPNLLKDGWGNTLISDPPAPAAANCIAAFTSAEVGSAP